MPSTPRPAPPKGWLRKKLALPAEHGAWSWWVLPLVVGTAASRALTVSQALVAGLALTTFLAHQPATVAVKAATGRGPRTDRAPALVWTALYGTLALLAFALLLRRGETVVLLPVAAGLFLFPLHLRLIARRQERRQLAFELVGASALALWAPAAYLAGNGAAWTTRSAAPVLLWVLALLPSAGAILSVYARLEQRTWKTRPPLGERVRTALPTILLHAAALVFAGWLFAPEPRPFGRIAFVPAFLDAWMILLRPRPRLMPRQIGFWYLFLAATFAILLVLQFA